MTFVLFLFFPFPARQISHLAFSRPAAEPNAMQAALEMHSDPGDREEDVTQSFTQNCPDPESPTAALAATPRAAGALRDAQNKSVLQVTAALAEESVEQYCACALARARARCSSHRSQVLEKQTAAAAAAC